MNKKGFAVSGIIYTLLVLFIILVIALLAMFNSRKTTLDELKEKILNIVNNNIKVDDTTFTPDTSNKIHKYDVVVEGYYKIELYSSNGSSLSTQMYFKEGDYIYLRVGSNSYNNGNSGVYSDEYLTKKILEVTNNTFSEESFENKNFLNTLYVKANNIPANGKAVISYIDTNRLNLNMRNIRYIKDCTTGNNDDNLNKWNEVRAIYKGRNVALNTNVTAYDVTLNEEKETLIPIDGQYNAITDNDLTTYSKLENESKTDEQCIIIDLGRTYNLDYIYTWHDLDAEKIYYNHKLSVSTAGKDYRTIYNYETMEKQNGIGVSAFQKSKTLLVGEIYTPIKQFDGAVWARLYHYNNQSGTIVWSASAQVLSKNGYDTVHKKSILYNLSNYIYNGKYELLLEYPDLNKYVRWIQTSDFTLSDKITGFSLKHNDFIGRTVFNGLRLNNTQSIISANDSIHYEIGTIKATGGIYGGNEELITGPTDLWIRIDENGYSYDKHEEKNPLY